MPRSTGSEHFCMNLQPRKWEMPLPLAPASFHMHSFCCAAPASQAVFLALGYLRPLHCQFAGIARFAGWPQNSIILRSPVQ